MIGPVKEITVEVTAEDIAHGQRGVGLNCPVALALQRALNNPKVRMGFETVSDWKGNPICRVPEEVTAFIHRFDTKGKGSPIKFTIQVPESRL